MEIKDVIDYIEKTPANTNPNVLGTMLEELGGSGGAATYVHTIKIEGGEEGSDPGDAYVNFTFKVYTHDATPLTTMTELVKNMPYLEYVAAEGIYGSVEVGTAYSQMFVQVRSAYNDNLQGTFAFFENDSLVDVRSDETITDLWGVECTITDTVTEF